MSPVNLILGVSNCMAAFVFVALAVPLVLGRVKRNVWYGVRFPQAMASDEAWEEINRYGGKRLMVCAIPLLIIGIMTFFLPLDSHPLVTVAVALAPLIVLVPACESWRFARRHARNT